MSPIHNATLNKQVRGDVVTPAASAARTATGDSGWLEADEYRNLSLTLATTAKTGTPTLNVTVETRENSSDSARSLGTFAQQTDVASERKTFVGLDRQYRVVWTIAGGSPNITFSITGIAK